VGAPGIGVAAKPINGLKDRAPKRIWLLVDDDPEQGYGGLLGWETTKKRATEECRRYNRIRNYAPTCRVVEYRPVEDRLRRA
jgi:hypothetical protein